MGSYMKNAASGGGSNVDSTPKREKSQSEESDESPLKRAIKKIRGTGTPSPSDSPYLHSYHRGGKVRKSGPANLKKGETVMTKSQMREMMKKRSKSRGKKRSAKKR